MPFLSCRTPCRRRSRRGVQHGQLSAARTSFPTPTTTGAFILLFKNKFSLWKEQSSLQCREVRWRAHTYKLRRWHGTEMEHHRRVHAARKPYPFCLPKHQAVLIQPPTPVQSYTCACCPKTYFFLSSSVSLCLCPFSSLLACECRFFF